MPTTRCLMIAMLLLTAAMIVAPTIASAQGTVTFRSIRDELATRPRGGVVDLFGRAVPQTGPRSAADLDAWFWRGVSPGRESADPARLRAAAELAVTGPYPAPTSERLRAVLDRHGEVLIDAAAAHGLSLPLLLALVMVESGGIADAVSSAGAVGLTQLMPATAELMEVADSRDPLDNAMGGARYLSRMLAEHDGDAILALAAYNAGPGAVSRAGGVPRYAETRAYVPKVLGAWTVARGLCAVPPVLPTGPCDLVR